MSSTIADEQRLDRLLGFLSQDPDNQRLLQDAAEAAFTAGRLEQAEALIARIAPSEALPPEVANLSGLVAIAQHRYDEAVTLLSPLHIAQPDDPALRFNLAWAQAMLGDYEEASELLDPRVLGTVPRAAALKVQMLHHLDRYEEALALGAILAEAAPDNTPLMGVLATLALDAEQPELARRYAEQGGEDPQALSARGTLALGDDDVATASRLFETAIARDPHSPRAWIGKGLALLAENKPAEAIPAIDRGAGLFKNHIGSWIASGWAHYAAGDEAGARASFERALAIDANFGETQGALAVLDIAAGNIEQGRRRAEVALRLDRGALGAQLAQLLLLERAGDASGVARIRERALSTPIGVGGRTIGQALANLARRRG